MEGLLPSHFPTERSQKKLNSLITALRQDPLEEGVSQKPKLLSNRLDGGKLQAIQVALRQKKGWRSGQSSDETSQVQSS